MIYITTMQHRRPRQITWEDVIADKLTLNDFTFDNSNSSATITKRYESIDQAILNKINVAGMIKWLKKFNEENKELIETDKNKLYYSFKIPKSTGGFRQIDAPNENLQTALRKLVNFLSEDCGILYHTSAFAYIKKRSIVDCVSKHQKANNNWFLKTDFSGFFPSTTLEFVMNMFSMIFPLSEVCKSEEGKEELNKALSLAFKNGGLPQGTCASPFITNAMMIPIDHALFNNLTERKLVYTRYADDIYVSGEECFPWKDIVKFIESTLNEFNAPFVIKKEKTHFGKKAGRSANWMLGLLLNKDNAITVSAKKKNYFKAALCSFILDTLHDKPWDIGDVMTLRGQLSYYTMVEPEYFNNIILQQNKKWNVDVKEMFRQYYNG